MLIDTHCHLDFPQFDSDRDLVLQRARNAGLRALINIGSSLKGSRESVRLAQAHADVFASVGLHPHDAKECCQETWGEIRVLTKENKVVAIGEVGLDYFRNLSPPEIQADVFRKSIGLAVERQLPLIVHCRQAEEEILRVFEDFQTAKLAGVVVHCFSGNGMFLKKCLNLGFFVSFTCNITYRKAQGLRDLVRIAPLERMFLETDAPFLSPEGKRGSRNEPACVVELAREIARIKNIDFEKVCAETTQNAKRFFRID